MNNIITLAIISSFIVIFSISTTTPIKNVEVVVKTKELNSPVVASKLRNEFNRMSNVVHIESSHLTNTFMIVCKEKTISEVNIQEIFAKWGCNDIDVSYELVN